MRRQVVRKEAAGVSLFPFLAVLICTMGALIVLLVLVVQQARVSASAATVAPVDGDEDELARRLRKMREAESDHEWRREVLAQKREEKTAEVANARNELSYLEQHIRELEEKWQLLQAQAAELQRLNEAKTTDQSVAQQRLTALQADLEQAKQDLDKARQQLAARPPAFAIIPFNTTNGTRRRPIYVECTADAVILQPEGVRLTSKDFTGPLTPGNPLDAALRAIREYWGQIEPAGQETAAYPLLVVRPAGVMAYSKARTAMRGWDDEFGYELIDEELPLSFPPADPRLNEILRKTIDDARRRQNALIAAMPGQFNTRGGGGGGGGGMVASSGGGFAPVGGGRSPAGRGTRGQETGFGQPGFGQPNRGQRGPGNSTNPSDGIDERQAGRGANPGDGSGSGDGPEQNQNGHPGREPNGHNNDQQSGSDGQSDGNDQSRQDSRSQQPGANASGQGQAGGGTAASSHAMGGMAGVAGPGGTSAAGSGGAAGSTASLATARGENWGLPNAAHGMVAVTRPLNVAVLPDRLVLLPGRGENWRPIITTVEGPLQSSVDAFVTKIWKQIQGWGIAVPGGYWKPVLVVEVLPGGEPRFQELQALLRDSGLEVLRKAD